MNNGRIYRFIATGTIESSRLVDPCPSRLESPRGSSRLIDPCSSRQELDAKRLEPARARGTPGLEGLEPARLEPGSSPLGSCTTLGRSLQEHLTGLNWL